MLDEVFSEFDTLMDKYGIEKIKTIGMLIWFVGGLPNHHYNGSIKYQALKSLPNTPQMPTGYPRMVILAFIPPLWVMNPRLEKVKEDGKKMNVKIKR